MRCSFPSVTAILALASVDENSETFGNVNYISQLKTYFADNQFGSPTLLNDDFWSILALASVNQKNINEVSAAKDFILANQNPDGGFSYAVGGESDTNDTAAAVMALVEQLSDDPEGALRRLDPWLPPRIR